jgi:hypothetical protein
MNVNFDNLRTKLVNNYNSLVDKLESNVKDQSWDPHIIVSTTEIEKELENISQILATLVSIYNEDGSFNSLDVDVKFFDVENPDLTN